MSDSEQAAAVVQLVEDSSSQQDGNNESRSAPPLDSVQPEGDCNEQQQDGHDNNAGAEEEDGGVKVHQEDDGEDEKGKEGEGEGGNGDKDPQHSSKGEEEEEGNGDEQGQGQVQEVTREVGEQNPEHPPNPEGEEEWPDPHSEIIPDTEVTAETNQGAGSAVEPKNPLQPQNEVEVVVVAEAPSTIDSLESESIPGNPESSEISGRDGAPDPQSEIADEINPSPAGTSAEESTLVDPIPETEEQNVNAEQEQEGQQEEEEQKNNTTESTELKAPSKGIQLPSKDTIITTENCDNTHTGEPPSPPPAEDQTPETGGQSVAAEEEEHAGTKAVEVVAVVTADEPDPKPSQGLPVSEPQEDEANLEKSIGADEGELPGEADSPPETKHPSVEISTPVEESSTPTTEPENIHRQDPVADELLTMSGVSEVSTLSDRPYEVPVAYQQSPTNSRFASTGFSAGPLDDEAAAAFNAEALAMSAVGVPDPGTRKAKKEKSHKKKDRSSADGVEKVKEKKHKDKGGIERSKSRERAKSRDRGDRGRRDKSELGVGERSRGKSRDPLRDEGKSRDRNREPREKEKKHRTPEEKAEREARKAAKKGLSAQTPVYADHITAMPHEEAYEPQYNTQYEEERPQEEKRKHKKPSKRSAAAEGSAESQVMGPPEMSYDQEDRKEKKKSKKPRPPPINIGSFQQQYDVQQPQDEQQKRRKSSKKAAAILGEPAIMGESPISPYIDGPIEQPKRKKSSKKSPPPDTDELVHVLHEPDSRPPPNRRSRSDSLKYVISGGSRGTESGSGSGGGGDKKHGHKRKDSAHLTHEEREERRRKHEEKALRKGRELENHLYNGSKEERRAERAARKAAKAKAEARENIPSPITPRFADNLNLPIQNPEGSFATSPGINAGQYSQGHDGEQFHSQYPHHRDQQDLNAPNPEPPFSPRSITDQTKAARRAERRARKEREARQTDAENLEQLKDSGHSLSSEGKRDHEHRERSHKSRDKTSRTRSRSRPPGPEDEEKRRRKEERREARRLAALNGNEVRDTGKEGKKSSKHKDGTREGGRARSGSERNREKDMMREVEMGYPEGYGNASQQPWDAPIEMGDEHREDVRGGLVRRAFSRFLKF